MAYQRNDENCDPVSPQPGSTTVNWFSGNEGWSTKTFKNWNADYQAEMSGIKRWETLDIFWSQISKRVKEV